MRLPPRILLRRAGHLTVGDYARQLLDACQFVGRLVDDCQKRMPRNLSIGRGWVWLHKYNILSPWYAQFNQRSKI